MVTLNNRVRYFTPPGPGFGQFPPGIERLLAFIAGLLAGLLLPVAFRIIGHLAR